MYNVTYLVTAQADIKEKDFDSDSVKKLTSFLKVDGCRVIGKRQQCINKEYNVWYFRVPMNGKGSRGGGRILYYEKLGNIYINRIFDKKEIGDDGKKNNLRIFEKAKESLIDTLKADENK